MTPQRRTVPRPAPSWLTPREAAEYLGSSPRTLREWRYLERGPAYHVLEGRIRYRTDDLDTYLASVRVDPTTPSVIERSA